MASSFRRSLDFTLAAGRNFGRQVLPYLKLFWPTLREVDRDSQESKCGLDFIAHRPDGGIQCAVCCRAFKGGATGPAEAQSIGETAQALRDSGLDCEILLLVHNGDGGNPEFRNPTASAWSELVSAGVARQAEIWDRQAIVQRASRKVMELLEVAFRRSSTELLYRQQSLFRFGAVYLPKAPMMNPTLAVSRFRKPSQDASATPAPQDIGALLRSGRDVPWTVLAGADGAGKTAAALHAARSQERVVIVVSSAALSVVEARHSLGKFLEDLVRGVDAFREFEDVHDQEVLYRFAGPVLAECLVEREKSPYLVVLDGLDGVRPAAERDKLEQVLRHLAGLRCQVVLTAAEAAPAKFADALKAFAAAKDHPRWLSLCPWTKRQMVEVASQALRTATGEERQHLAEFLVLLQNEQFGSVYKNVPCYPLFLQMILEEVAESGVRPCNRSELLRGWVNRRIQRAFASPRDLVPACGLLEDIAGRMILENSGSFELTETLPQRSIQTLANRRFPGGEDSFTPLLLGSVLVSQPSGRNANFNVAFAFETVQAYFTARYLARQNLPATGYPDSVQGLHHELLSGG